LLGQFAIDVDGRTLTSVQWRRRAPGGLVKLLALQPARRLHRDQVIDALWPDLLVNEALPRLHKASHYARTALGDREGIVVDGAAIALWPDADVRVDTGEFERAVAAARQDGGAEAARAAAALYGGDLLPDDLYEPWTDEPRSRLRLWWLEMLPVAGMYEELVTANPLDEEAHLALVRQHLGAGRRQPALGALDRMAVVLQSELGVEPSSEAQELRLLAEALPIPIGESAGVHRGLPAARSRLIGRDPDLSKVAELLRQHRIVTITGPGGAGKSTLALAAARQATETQGPELDVVFAELAAARDADAVTRVVAEAAGVEGEGALDTSSLAANLSRRRALLVLDNCEHLLDASASLVDGLLDAGSSVRVLATSREPLAVNGEAEHRLGSLGPPAVELFVERAQAVRADSVDPDDPQIAELCDRLDGLPLAIELAAAQLRHLSLSEIVARLDDRLRLLAGGRFRAGDRHSALHATIDWSYQLLGSDTSALFRQLAVFPASFDLAAAIAVSGDDSLSLTGRLGELVAKSLVVYDADRRRYSLLETVRLFASERLADEERRDAEELLRNHVVSRARAEPRARAWLSTVLSARSRDDLDNVRWAFRASLDSDQVTDALDIAIGLSTVWRNATSYAEGRQWVADLQSRPSTPDDKMWAAILGADIGLGAGDAMEMRMHADSAAALSADAGDPPGAIIAEIYRSMVHLVDPAKAVEHLAAAAASAADLGEEGLSRLARGYRVVALLLLGATDEIHTEARALTEDVTTRDYALYLCRWAASLVALVDRDGAWQDRLMTCQRDELAATGLRENWLTMYWGALTSIGLGDEYVGQLARARAWARAEGRQADADCVLALAYAAACDDDWERAAELVGATQGALLHDTAGYLHQAIIRDRLVRPRLDPHRYAVLAGRGRDLGLAEVLSDHGL
jgi:predicted ATPase/DNA-binding SARP family transcriptional activator